MGALLESPPRELSFADLSAFSSKLAEDVGKLTPRNEGYTVEDYFKLDGNYLVEFADGRLQILAMPTLFHQAIAVCMYNAMLAWIEPDEQGRTAISPVRIMLDERRWREPDVALMLGVHADRRTPDFWRGADLVIEIISDSNRAHDAVTKRAEYAAAGIPEYWIVDPAEESVTVLVLPDSGERIYAELGKFDRGDIAAGQVAVGFAVPVAVLFDTARRRS